MIVTSLSTFISSSNKASFPSLIPVFLPSFLLTFRPFVLPPYLASFLPTFLPSFLPSFFSFYLPSLFLSFLPFLHPSFHLLDYPIYSIHQSFLPSFLLSFFSSFSPSLTSPSFFHNFIIFTELLEHDQDYLPAVLGMATGFMVEKAQVCVTIAKMRERRD